MTFRPTFFQCSRGYLNTFDILTVCEFSKMSAVRKSYSLEVKLSAIEMSKRSDNVKAAKHFEVDESCVRRWVLKEAGGPIPSGRDALEESRILVELHSRR